MENEQAGSNPAGDDVRNEVADIMSNKQNPRHEGYHRQDKKVLDYVDGLYKKAYGTATVDLSDGLTAGGLDEGQRPGSTEDAASPKDAEADDFAIRELRGEWGDRFDTQIDDARHGMMALSTTLGVDADDLIGAFLGAGGDRAVGIKTLASYGRGHKA